jgi:hypothetical protein
MSSVAPVPEVFQRLFLATGAPMGQTWLLSTRIPLTELALHRQALASKVPLVAKVLMMLNDRLSEVSKLWAALARYA